MTAQWIELLWPLAFIAFVFAVVAGWLVIELRRKPWVKFLLIPLFLFAGWSTQSVYISGLGHAVPQAMPRKFVYLGHRVVISDAKRQSIEVWTGGLDGVGSKLIAIPYSRKTEDALMEAQSKGARGGVVVIEVEEGHGNGTTKSESALSSNLITPNVARPKQ